MIDAMSHPAAVTLTRANELDQPQPCEAVVAACDIFMADAIRAAVRTPSFITKSQPPEKE